MQIFMEEYPKTMSGRHRVTNTWKTSRDCGGRGESAASPGQATLRVRHHKKLEDMGKDSPLEGLLETWS